MPSGKWKSFHHQLLGVVFTNIFTDLLDLLYVTVYKHIGYSDLHLHKTAKKMLTFSILSLSKHFWAQRQSGPTLFALTTFPVIWVVYSLPVLQACLSQFKSGYLHYVGICRN
ncbi:unnamed protein product, partial [Meganyctiphanes norvegica]